MLAILAAGLSSSVWRLPSWMNWLGVALGVLVLGSMILTWIVGLVKGFPDWSLPALGVGFFVLTYLMDGGVGWLDEFFKLNYWPDSILGRISMVTLRDFLWIPPVVAMAVIVLLLIRPFYRRVRQDWSLLSFLFLGVAIPPLYYERSLPASCPFQNNCLAGAGDRCMDVLKMAHPLATAGNPASGDSYAITIYALRIYIAYPLEDWAQVTTFPRWWEAIYPLLGVPAIRLLISLPAVVDLFPRPKPAAV